METLNYSIVKCLIILRTESVLLIRTPSAMEQHRNSIMLRRHRVDFILENQVFSHLIRIIVVINLRANLNNLCHASSRCADVLESAAAYILPCLARIYVPKLMYNQKTLLQKLILFIHLCLFWFQKTIIKRLTKPKIVNKFNREPVVVRAPVWDEMA